MKHVIKNDLNIKKEDIAKEVTRIKALLINNENEILVGYSDNIYQFIGGHLEDEETLIECLNREINEEVGINLNISNLKPFLLLEHYCNDFPSVDENINCKVYYYVIKTNHKPNLNKTNLTEEEKRTNFQFEYIKLDKLVETITNNFKRFNHAKLIGEEMIYAYNVYKSYYELTND